MRDRSKVSETVPAQGTLAFSGKNFVVEGLRLKIISEIKKQIL